MYCAHSIYTIWFWSDLLIIATHLITFLLVYTFSCRLLLNRPGAFLATLLYATSLPVLYYLGRVSVEPFLIGLQLCSFLSVWNSQDAAQSGSWRIAILWAVIAGALSMAAVFTKMHLAFALPAFVLLMLFFGDSTRYKVPLRRRTLLALASFLTALISIPGWLSLMNWEDFLRSWWTVVGSYSAPFNEAFLSLVEPFKSLFRHFSPLALIPAFNLSNLFFFCEFGLVVLALAGFFVMFRNRLPTLGQFFWVILFSLFPLSIWLYRSGIFTAMLQHRVQGAPTDFHGFHYLFPLMPLLCTSAAYLSIGLVKRLRTHVFDCKNLLIIVGLTAIVHHTVFWCVFDSRQQDVSAFARFDSALRKAMALITSQERIALIVHSPVAEEDLRIGGLNREPWHWQPARAESALVKEIQGLFVVLPSSLSSAEAKSLIEGMNIAAVVEIGVNRTAMIHPIKEWVQQLGEQREE